MVPWSWQLRPLVFLLVMMQLVLCLVPALLHVQPVLVLRRRCWLAGSLA